MSILSPFRAIKFGVQNLVAYLPTIWHTREWDWASLTELMELKLRRMAAHQENCPSKSQTDKSVKSMKIAAVLLKRLQEDEYGLELEGYAPEIGSWITHGISARPIKDYATYMQQQDLDYFCKIFNKNLRKWWD